ncbi:MAG: hypothetical protein KatS3mg090_0049 [Patescibacteria group bacterium]|nr:MAG: hypothetical protein KatS3mg090_0049 [Patescibacteria group bacterium]
MRIINVATKGNTDIVDITYELFQLVNKEDFENGLVHLFVKGSTAAITTMENDPNLFEDFRTVLDKLVPYNFNYKHHQTWGDNNGAAHIRASLIGMSLIVPVLNGNFMLGAYQRIVVIDFDTKPRNREVVISFIKSTY